MLFNSVNILKELAKKQEPTERLLEEVNALLRASADKDQALLERLNSPNTSSGAIDHIELSHLDKDKLFSLDNINQICVKYRLRFLSSEHFKAEFPYEALQKIRVFEEENAVKIKQFKLLAPYGMFQLKEVNEDPLLFAQLSDNSYYLIHKWGKDLSWYRGIINYPLQSIYSFFSSTVLLAAIVAWSIPFDWLNVARENEFLFRFWLNTHFTIAFFFFILFMGSLSNASFSDSSWNSKYYNG